MNYTKVEMNGYNLYFIKTKKFKTINIAAHFKETITNEGKIYSDVLRRVLSYATGHYHNLDDLNRAGMDLYGPSVRIGFLESGLDRTFYLNGSFVNEKYTEKGMNKKSIEYILSHIWDPYVKDNAFDKSVFDLSLHEYIESLNSIKDNPDRYAEERIWEEIDIRPYKDFNIDESIKFAKNITSEDLYEYYLNLFENNSLDIFITGDTDEKEITKIIEKIVKGHFTPSYKNRYIAVKPRNIKEVVETIDTEQSRLNIALKYVDLTDFERKYVSLVYNNILGGGWDSKLNRVVREENSLCYYIYAMRKINFSLAIISSGIDAKNADKTIKLVKKQLDKMHTEISEEDLARVKEIYYNALTELEDNQTSISNNVISMISSDTDSIEDRKANMAKVTVDDVKKLASKVYIDTIYLLEGKNLNGKENV